MLGCSVTTGMGAVINTAKVQPGNSVAIFGLSGIGLSATIGAQMDAAGRIIGIDLNTSQFELSRKLGATDLINPRDYDRPIQDVIVELTDVSVDFSFECIGNVNVMCSALECAIKAGAKRSLSESPAQAKKSPPGRSSWSPAACGAVPLSAA